MLTSNLYIPKKIHVGYQLRDDTYTGKLAYIIYEDETGVIRKKASWDNWINKTLEQHVFDNVPTRYIFNKGVQRQGYYRVGSTQNSDNLQSY